MRSTRYISDQRVSRLQYPIQSAEPVSTYLHWLSQTPEERETASAHTSWREVWPLVSRQELTRKWQLKRIVVTSAGSGFGRRTFLGELTATISYFDPSQFVFRFNLEEIPNEPWKFIDSGRESDSIGGERGGRIALLCQAALEQFNSLKNRGLLPSLQFPPEKQVNSLVRQALHTGDVTIVVCNLNQMVQQEVQQRLAALMEFVGANYYPNTRLVIEGSPAALIRCGKILGLDHTTERESDERNDSQKCEIPDWAFYNIEEFSPSQSVDFLRRKRKPGEAEIIYNRLHSSGFKDLHRPRTLAIIRPMTSAQMDKVQTASDLYWFTINESIRANSGLVPNPKDQRLKNDHVLAVLSSIAFAMQIWKETPISIVSDDDCNALIRFMHDAGFVSVLDKQNINFAAVLSRTARCDTQALEFNVSEKHSKQNLNVCPSIIQFLDDEYRNFYSAHWAAKYLSPQLSYFRQNDNKKIVASIPNPIQILEANNNTVEFRRFWELLVEMPDIGIDSTHGSATDIDSWCDAVRPLLCSKLRIPPKDIMLRVFPDLLWRAGYQAQRDRTNPANWSETTTAQAYSMARQDVRKQFEDGSHPDSASSSRQLIYDFFAQNLDQIADTELELGGSDRIASERSNAQGHNRLAKPIYSPKHLLRSPVFWLSFAVLTSILVTFASWPKSPKSHTDLASLVVLYQKYGSPPITEFRLIEPYERRTYEVPKLPELTSKDLIAVEGMFFESAYWYSIGIDGGAWTGADTQSQKKVTVLNRSIGRERQFRGARETTLDSQSNNHYFALNGTDPYGSLLLIVTSEEEIPNGHLEKAILVDTPPPLNVQSSTRSFAVNQQVTEEVEPFDTYLKNIKKALDPSIKIHAAIHLHYSGK